MMLQLSRNYLIRKIRKDNVKVCDYKKFYVEYLPEHKHFLFSFPPTYLSKFSQNAIIQARSKCRFVRDTFSNVTAHRATFASNFISSYRKWKAQTERKIVKILFKLNLWKNGKVKVDFDSFRRMPFEKCPLQDSPIGLGRSLPNPFPI